MRAIADIGTDEAGTGRMAIDDDIADVPLPRIAYGRVIIVRQYRKLTTTRS